MHRHYYEMGLGVLGDVFLRKHMNFKQQAYSFLRHSILPKERTYEKDD